MNSKVRQLRRERNISSSDIYKALDINHATFSKKERGKLRFSLEEAKKLSEIFDLPIDAIFFDLECAKIEQKE